MPNTAQPSDLMSKRYPVSIKGIVEWTDKIILLKNERDEWELPGGKLEHNETPVECVEREILEELNLSTKVTTLLDVWVYNILNEVEVLIVTFGTKAVNSTEGLKVSPEHKELGLFSLEEIGQLNMPHGYKNSIAQYYRTKGIHNE